MSMDGWKALYNAGTHVSYHECDALALLRYCTMGLWDNKYDGMRYLTMPRVLT